MKTIWFVMLVTSIGVVLNAQTNTPVSETNLPHLTTPSTNPPANVSAATNSVTETNFPPDISSTNNSSHNFTTPSGPFTTIESKTGYFDLKSRVAIYRRDVHVKDPQVNMTCDDLTVYLPPQSGGRPNKIVALGHVVIDFENEKGQTNHVNSDKAVYIYDVTGSETNETVTFTGHATLRNQMGTMTAEPIIWDRTRGTVSAQNQKMELRSIVAPTNLFSNPQSSTNK